MNCGARFQIKICGITSTADAQMCADLGADALGLNFYPRSPRCITLVQAAEIVAHLPTTICKVGLFVNATAGEIKAAHERLGLDLVQLHGDEPPELVAELQPLRVMRAFRCTSDLKPVVAYLARCHALGVSPASILLDAYRAGEYGGTGAVADWSAIASSRTDFGGIPLVLAGGLNATNVAAAIAQVAPAAVDTASGVESSPGKKSEEFVRAFIEAARNAFTIAKPPAAAGG